MKITSKEVKDIINGEINLLKENKKSLDSMRIQTKDKHFKYLADRTKEDINLLNSIIKKIIIAEKENNNAAE